MIDLDKDEIYKRRLAKEISPRKTTDVDKGKKQEEPKEQLIKEDFTKKRQMELRIRRIEREMKQGKGNMKNLRVQLKRERNLFAKLYTHGVKEKLIRAAKKGTKIPSIAIGAVGAGLATVAYKKLKGKRKKKEK